MKTFWHCIPALTLLISTSIAHAGDVRVVATGENWVEVVVDASDIAITSGSPYDRIDVPGWMWLHQPGAPAVPVRGATLGMPYGSRAVVQVLNADYEEIEGLDLMPVPQTQLLGSEQHPFSRSVYLRDEIIYNTPDFIPVQKPLWRTRASCAINKSRFCLCVQCSTTPFSTDFGLHDSCACACYYRRYNAVTYSAFERQGRF